MRCQECGRELHAPASVNAALGPGCRRRRVRELARKQLTLELCPARYWFLRGMMEVPNG